MSDATLVHALEQIEPDDRHACRTAAIILRELAARAGDNGSRATALVHEGIADRLDVVADLIDALELDAGVMRTGWSVKV